MFSKHPDTLALILGLVIPFVGGISSSPIIPGLIYFIGGGLLGFLWPKEFWRASIIIVLPLIALVVLSVLFVGEFGMFIKKDLPVILIAIISAFSGSILLSRFKNSWTKGMKK